MTDRPPSEIFKGSFTNLRADKFREEEQAMVEAIVSAKDVVWSVLEWEPITEPVGAGKAMRRPVVEEWRSVALGYRLLMKHNYLYGPESRAWGAEADRTYSMEAI